MYYRLKSLSCATATLLLPLISPLLPFPVNPKPLVVKVQTTQYREFEALRLNHEGIQLVNKGLFREGLEIPETRAQKTINQDRNAEANQLFQQGTQQFLSSQFQAALESWQQALRIYQEVGNRKGESLSLLLLGRTYYVTGQYQQAIAHYRRSLDIARERGDRFGEGTSLTGIGLVYSMLGQNSQALESLQQALAILREIGNRGEEGITLGFIGMVYSSQGEYPQALVSLEQALAIHREVGNRYGEIAAFTGLVEIYITQKQYPQALTLLQQALAISREIPFLAAEGIVLTFLGEVYTDQRQYPQALESYQQALAIHAEVGNRYGEGFTLSRIGNLLAEQNQPELAIVFYKQYVNITEAIRQNLRTLPREQQESYTKTLADKYRRLADLLLTRDRVLEAQRVLDLLKVQELDDYLRNVRGNTDDDRIELILTTPDSPPIRRTVQVPKKQLNETIAAFRSALLDRTSDAKTPAQKLYTWLIKPLEADLKAADAQTIIYAPDAQLRYIPLAALYDGQQWLVQRYRINNITAASLTDLNTKPQPQMQVLAGAFATGRYSFTVGGQSFDFTGLPFAGTEVENLAKTVPTTTKFIDKAFSPQITVPQMDDYTVVHLATHAAFVVGTPDDSFILFGNGDRITLRDIQNWSLKNVDLVVLSACETGLGGKLGNGEEILGLGYQMQRAGARAAIASLWTVDDGGTQALMNAFYANLKQGNTTKAEALRQAQITLITGDSTALGEDRGSLTAEQRDRPLGGSEANRTNLPPQQANALSHPYYWAPFILIGNGL